MRILIFRNLGRIARRCWSGRARRASPLCSLSGLGRGRKNWTRPFPLPSNTIGFYATVGTHPHEAKELTLAHLERLAELAKHPRVIAYGEIGLDYFYDHFAARGAAARFSRANAVGGQREAPACHSLPRCLGGLHGLAGANWRPTGLGGILHCFTSTLEDAKRGLDMGFLISFAGNSTYPKAQNLRDVAKALPLEKLLIETDSPFLAPQPYRGKRNEPAYVGEVAKAIGSVRNLAAEEVALATAGNFRRFFGLSAGQPARSVTAEPH